MDQLSGLIEALRSAPTDRIVDTLRALHQARPGESPTRHAARDTARRHVDRTPRSMPRGNDSGSRRSAPDDGPRTDADRYDHARRFFVGLEKRLTRERGVMESLIEGLRHRERAHARPTEPASQQLLRIVAVEGSPGGGRFVVTNPSDREAPITLAARSIRARVTGTPCVVPTVIEPAHVVVAAGGWTRVGLTIDPEGLALRTGEPLDLCIEATNAGRVVMKLHVEVDVYPEESTLA